MPAHCGKRADRFGKTFGHGGLGAAPFLLILFGVADLHHALERQEAVDCRRRRFDLPRQLSCGRQHRFEHGSVDANHRRRAGALDGQAGLNGAAGESLGGARAHPYLDRIPAGRQAEPQIESLAVDRFDLPGPGIGAAHAMAASKSGHAQQRHGRWSPANQWKNSR